MSKKIEGLQNILGTSGTGVPYRELFLVAIVALFVTMILTSVFKVLAVKVGLVSVPRERDVHLLPTPTGGGIAVYIGFAAAIFLANQLPALTRSFKFSSEMPAVVIGGAVIVLVGLIDDRWGLDALTKLAGQITSALVMVLLGVRWFLVYIPGIGTIAFDERQSTVITVLIVVSLMNAFNFLDGLDGLVSGVGAISGLAIALFSMGLLQHQGGDVSYYPPVLIAVVLAGACLGFLPHNFFPAKIFIGDTGAMFIGLVIAAADTSVSGRISPASYGVADIVSLLSPLLLALAVMALPMFDLILAIVRRTRSAQGFWVADKMHVHHRLLELGHNQRRVVIILYFWVGVLSLIVISREFVNGFIALLISIIGIIFVVSITFGGSIKNRIFRKERS